MSGIADIYGQSTGVAMLCGYCGRPVITDSVMHGAVSYHRACTLPPEPGAHRWLVRPEEFKSFVDADDTASFQRAIDFLGKKGPQP